MNTLFKIIKWGLISIIFVVLATMAYAYYVVASFDTSTLPENHGQVKTELFLSGQDSGQPLIVGLGGADGGNPWASKHGEKQRAMLKKNGFAFLSVAYFGEQGIPETLDRIAIEGVHGAVTKASLHPNINANCIAVMGVSRGSELALLLASNYSQYKSVIGIVPGNAVFASLTSAMTTAGFSHQGRALPFVPVPWSTTGALISGDLRSAFETMLENTQAVEAAAIEVEKISGSILLISATKDEQWPSTEMSEMMITRLKENNFPHKYTHIALQGGHNEHHDNFHHVIGFLNQQLSPTGQPGCAR